MILLAIAPTLVTLLCLLLTLPFTLAWHRAAATRPVDALPADGWALGLLDALDASEALAEVDAAWLALDSAPIRNQRAPRRTARAVQRSRMHHAAHALRTTPAPAYETTPLTQRTPYAPAWMAA